MASLDNPTETDHLEFQPYVEGIAELIRQQTPETLPMTLGIYGAWGSGKTSFMLQLRKRFCEGVGDQGPPSVWFEAWKYERVEDVPMALINSILLAIDKEVSGSAKKKAFNLLSQCRQMAWVYVEQTKPTIAAPGGGPSLAVSWLKEARQSVTGTRKLHTLVDQFENEFAAAVSQYLGVRHGQLIVFIDDLDRCLPGNVINILEGLKLFLNKAQCVFVIGVDRAVVEKAIQAHYGVGPGVAGRDYLDKIIQYPFAVPPPQTHLSMQHFGEVTKAVGLNEEPRSIREIAAEGNPRTYLRILTSWKIIKALAPRVGLEGKGSLGENALMLAASIHIRFPQLHEACRRRAERVGGFYELAAAESGELSNIAQNIDFQYPEFKSSWEDASIRRFCKAVGRLDLAGC